MDAPERLAALPNVPTFSEIGVKDVARVWFGSFLPPGTPRVITKQVNEGNVAALKDPAVAESMRKDRFQVVGNTPEQFAAENIAEMKTGEKLVRALNIRLD